MKYEIYFFATDMRKMSNAHTYQVEADNLLDAFNMWAQDWPEGCAYAAKEGWHITGPGVITRDPNKIVEEPKPEGKLASLLNKKRK